MKLRSDILTGQDISNAFKAAKDAGKVARDIFFVTFDEKGSRGRKYGYELQLGTYNKTSGPTKSRHYKNSGQYGADTSLVYAASYDEWGWFIAELFDLDCNAIFGPYLSLSSFNEQTKNAYVLSHA